MSKFEFSPSLSEKLQQSTQSFELRALKKGSLVVDYSHGPKYKYYDWASLTKVVFTTTAVMKAFDQGLVDLSKPIKHYLNWFPSEKVKVEQLLAHYSGLEWWLPIYEELNAKNMLGRENYPDNWNFVIDLIQSQPINESVQQATYSDLDFWVLGFLLEKIYDKEIFKIWSDLSSELGLSETGFSIHNSPQYSRGDYAPTEDCPWRGKVIQGEVHDDNTWALGGVASHAGLLGPMSDLVAWSQGLRGAYLAEKEWVVKSETVREFFQKTGPGSWALGFMMPDLEDSPVGKRMSRNSIGHWGFTGTGFWYDLDHDYAIITLSNRVHPSRKNELYKELRPEIHDEVFEYLEKSN